MEKNPVAKLRRLKEKNAANVRIANLHIG